jgi:uncharacterized protein
MIADLSLLNKLTENPPLLDLFEQLRRAGMQLTLDHYDWLNKVLWMEDGVRTWEELRRVCLRLWVKPSENYDRATFEREFDDYCDRWQEVEVPMSMDIITISTPITTISITPIVPPRVMPKVGPPTATRSVTAVKTGDRSKLVSSNDWQLTPSLLPTSVPRVQESWRSLRSASPTARLDEVDVDRTVAQFCRDGVWGDVVLRSSLVARSELVVLVDEGAAMIPFMPALRPLFQAIEGGWVSPARLYRFTGYPERFLYEWLHPSRAIAVTDVLARLHCSRTIVVVVSDAGAAIGVGDDDRLEGIQRFLVQWRRSVRQLLWINPLPEARWAGTPAAEICGELGGQMLGLELLAGATVRRLAQMGQRGGGR